MKSTKTAKFTVLKNFPLYDNQVIFWWSQFRGYLPSKKLKIIFKNEEKYNYTGTPACGAMITNLHPYQMNYQH